MYKGNYTRHTHRETRAAQRREVLVIQEREREIREKDRCRIEQCAEFKHNKRR